MKLEVQAEQMSDLVSLETGEIDRRIFADEDIFERELDLIFGRAWNFLCHETQIPKAGDFFETPVGRDNVLTVRQKDGTIKAMINTCMHRGNAVCRAEEGNTKAFMCTYHGWSYDLAGNLIGVPDYEKFFKGRLNKDELGLREVPQVENYHGFVFGTMDPTAPPLEEFLGPAGKLGIDLSACQDIEIIPGIQKFTINCNWKFAVDNLFDWYHPPVTHMSAAVTSIFANSAVKSGNVVDGGGAQTTLGEELDIPASLGISDEIAFIGEYGHAIGGPSIDGLPVPYPEEGSEWRRTPLAKEWLGPVGQRSFGHPNIFPNSWLTANLQLSLRVPLSANRTEIWWFTFVEKGASDEERRIKSFQGSHGFGPAGLLEQEDGENWAQSTLQTHGLFSQTIPQILKMDLGHGEVLHDEGGRAYIEGSPSEHGQMWLYHCWAEWMKGTDWDSLREATMPPSVL